MPLVLFFSHGGWVTAVAATIMLIFHFGILSSIPMGVPLEWNVFMMFGILAIFVGHPDIGLADLQSPWPLLLFAVSAGTVIIGNLMPRKVSFLPGMRYYAGNWDTGLWCIKPSASAKIEQGIVAIASMLSFFGGGLVPAYSASKGGIAQLTKSLAIGWAPDGIRVNAVAPGFVHTPLTAAAASVPGVVEDYVDNTALGRAGTPEDIANAVVYLSSPGSSWLTGEVLDINGGAHLKRYPDVMGHVMRLVEQS